MTRTTSSPVPTTDTGRARSLLPARSGGRGHHPGWTAFGVVVGATVAGAAAFAFLMRTNNADGDGWQSSDVLAQGVTDDVYEPSGARILRRDDGILVELDVPTPPPGTYTYPTNDMLPPWVPSHPVVGQGARDAPEVFTLWFFAFNTPSACTDGRCDSDDIGTETPARGGVYQVDGRIDHDGRLEFAGNVRLGQQQLDGAALADPLGAQIHLAIAPHGRALSGDDRIVQLNTPVGNPTLWWGASFDD